MTLRRLLGGPETLDDTARAQYALETGIQDLLLALCSAAAIRLATAADVPPRISAAFEDAFAKPTPGKLHTILVRLSAHRIARELPDVFRIANAPPIATLVTLRTDWMHARTDAVLETTLRALASLGNAEVPSGAADLRAVLRAIRDRDPRLPEPTPRDFDVRCGSHFSATGRAEVRPAWWLPRLRRAGAPGLLVDSGGIDAVFTHSGERAFAVTPARGDQCSEAIADALGFDEPVSPARLAALAAGRPTFLGIRASALETSGLADVLRWVSELPRGTLLAVVERPRELAERDEEELLSTLPDSMRKTLRRAPGRFGETMKDYLWVPRPKRSMFVPTWMP